VHSAFIFPRFKILSGAERLILKLAGALIEKGMEISIVCHQFDPSCAPIFPADAKLKISGITMDYFRNRYWNAIFDYIRQAPLQKLIPPSVDIVCCFGPAITLAKTIQRKMEKPVLYFCYEPPRFLYTDRAVIRKGLGPASFLLDPLIGLYKQRDKRLVQNVDQILCNSQFGRSKIREIYNRDAQVITHGLDPYVPSTKRETLRSRFGFSQDDIVVITVNFLHPRKRVDLFLKAIEKAQLKVPRIKGLVVGTGPEKEILQSQTSPELARFAGFVPEQELSEHYQAADIYMHTASQETFGLSVIEASGNKLPVISVQEGGPTETVLHGKTGMLCEATPEALATALMKLAEDDALRKAMGDDGFRFVRAKYSWEKGADDFIQAIQNFAVARNETAPTVFASHTER
jgi:glycosyltransferase involved in cell wall biosynthesis